ncbi:transcriptional regulator [Sesbania bispinosa]|nr:transcriptional regulator [Sesbania bispinosa]
MASKISPDSSYLVLLFLLSNIVIVNSAFFTIQKEAKVGDSSRKHVVHNIPSSFQALPKGQTIPVSGPSQRQNGLEDSDYTLFSKAQELMKTLNNHEEASARARAPTPAGTLARDSANPPSGTSKCRNKFVDYWLCIIPGRKLKFIFPSF